MKTSLKVLRIIPSATLIVNWALTIMLLWGHGYFIPLLILFSLVLFTFSFILWKSNFTKNNLGVKIWNHFLQITFILTPWLLQLIENKEFEFPEAIIIFQLTFYLISVITVKTMIKFIYNYSNNRQLPR